MNCHHCHTANEPHSRFCRQCGRSLRAAAGLTPKRLLRLGLPPVLVVGLLLAGLWSWVQVSAAQVMAEARSLETAGDFSRSREVLGHINTAWLRQSARNELEALTLRQEENLRYQQEVAQATTAMEKQQFEAARDRLLTIPATYSRYGEVTTLLGEVQSKIEAQLKSQVAAKEQEAQRAKEAKASAERSAKAAAEAQRHAQQAAQEAAVESAYNTLAGFLDQLARIRNNFLANAVESYSSALKRAQRYGFDAVVSANLGAALVASRSAAEDAVDLMERFPTVPYAYLYAAGELGYAAVDMTDSISAYLDSDLATSHAKVTSAEAYLSSVNEFLSNYGR